MIPTQLHVSLLIFLALVSFSFLQQYNSLVLHTTSKERTVIGTFITQLNVALQLSITEMQSHFIFSHVPMLQMNTSTRSTSAINLVTYGITVEHALNYQLQSKSSHFASVSAMFHHYTDSQTKNSMKSVENKH